VTDPRTLELLRDMREYAQHAMDFLAGKSVTDVQTDRMLLFALNRAVEIVGEAASKIDPAVRGGPPGIPWREAIDMQNLLIHGYHRVRADYVYKTVRDDFPPLIAELDATLGTLTP